MILGRYYSQVSKKGRVALPSRFRKETGNRIILARWYDDCLVIVGLPQWEKLVARLIGQDEVVIRPIRSVERFILSTAFELVTDDQGRFVIPPTLRDAANIKENVVFLGLDERIELWDVATWEEQEKKVRSEANEVLEEISEKRRRQNVK
jgi:MraZ protein